MRVSTLLPLALCGIVLAWATDAQNACNNPPGVQYVAQMTASKNAGIDAQIVAETGPDGCANLTVNINGKTFTEGGPFRKFSHTFSVFRLLHSGRLGRRPLLEMCC